jgi:polyhydroxyalkanoate synthesis regulator phasin
VFVAKESGQRSHKVNTIGGIIKRLNKTLLVGATIVSLGASSVVGMGLAHAATTSANQDSLVDKIASKFNLNKSDVQKVFDDDRTAHQAEREHKMKERLDQAVKDGKLTQAQADKLIAKHEELEATRQANRDAMKDKTEAERKAAMGAERTAYKQWLTDNGIPAEFGMMGGHGRMGGPGGPPSAN